MKKGIIAITIVVLGGIFVLAYFMSGSTWNRLGTDAYYVHITEDGTYEEETLDNGDVVVRYDYRLDGYDENGKKQTLQFYALKNLRHDAYLKIFYKESKGVTSYEEVKKEEVPSAALQLLEA